MTDQSIDLLARWEQGDQQAAQELFDRYANRLAALAQSRSSKRLRRRVEADDIVQSVYRSFFRKAEQGRFTLENSGDLWRLLAAITVAKVKGKVEFHTAQKRAMNAEDSLNTDRSYFVHPVAVAGDPQPDDAAMLVEQLSLVLETLEPIQRAIVELALQNQTIEQISKEVGRSQRTVRRTLQNLRDDLEEQLYKQSVRR